MGAQLGATDTERAGCYRTARLLSARADMVVCAGDVLALRQDSEVMGFFFSPRGGNLKCLGRRRL